MSKKDLGPGVGVKDKLPPRSTYKVRDVVAPQQRPAARNPVTTKNSRVRTKA